AGQLARCGHWSEEIRREPRKANALAAFRGLGCDRQGNRTVFGAFRQFLADYLHVLLRIDAEPHRVALDLDEGNGDLISKLNPFTQLAAEHQHDGSTPCLTEFDAAPRWRGSPASGGVTQLAVEFNQVARFDGRLGSPMQATRNSQRLTGNPGRIRGRKE